MTVLPSIAEAEKLLPHDSPASSLYATVLLPAERAAIQTTDKHVDFRVIFARVVGYLLLYPPSDQARTILQGEVARCKDESDQNQAVYDLGKTYLMDLILPLYWPSSTDGTPQPLFRDYKRASFQRIQEKALQRQPERPRNVSEAKGFAFIRDGFRCMVSRVGDGFAVHGGIIPLEPQDSSSWVPTNCCHIFPEALELEEIRGDGTGAVQMEHAAALWAILGRFGYGWIHDELKGAYIHRLENMMTLTPGIHAYFRNMHLWLEEAGAGQTDYYRIGVSWPLIREGNDPPLPERVQFVARVNLPLPNPTYLHIHATCCHIAHLSGAWDHLEAIFCDGLEAAMNDEGEEELNV
ncbi:hypothetical protein LXA43DRAFT_1044466 [Ganoderma leucocontextum]|nr:hypothetical protein LXA43DRAFT_1044466 [Ganoderma leucocontextum]